MENERAGLHELKLADLREQLREANRTIAALREGEKERVRLAERVKDRDLDISKAVHEGVEEEKRKAKRVISKQDLMIKALEKQLADERSMRNEYEKSSIEMKKHVAEVESRCKAELTKAAEQLEATAKQLRDEYDHLEASYVSLLADKEREMSAALSKRSAEHEAAVTQLTKQQRKALATLQAHQKSVIADKEQYIIVLSTRLDESTQRVAALDKSINEMLSERQRDLRTYSDTKHAEENRFREELALRDKIHTEELDRIYLRVKNAVTKKDEAILRLKAELALVQKKMQEISLL